MARSASMNSGSTSPRSRSFDSSSHRTFETSECTTPDQEELDTSSLNPVHNICFVGAGYVGGPTAAVIALQNPHITVSVVDKDPLRIQKWKSRHLPVHEPNLDLVVRIARDGLRFKKQRSSDLHSALIFKRRRGNLVFSTEVERCIAEADLIFIAVNTPTKTRGMGAGAATNLAAFESAMVTVAKCAKPRAIIVEKSTVPCGTAQTAREILALYRSGEEFEVLSNPEFLAEGTAIRDLLHPDRILIGSAKTLSGLAAAERLRSVYTSWVDPSKIMTVNVWSSELAKVVANAMLAQRISSINTISAICDQTGAEIDEVALAIGKDTRLGSKFLKAGLGFGGSCFKKDILALTYLAQSLHLPEVADYWMSVLAINDFQQTRFTRKVVTRLNGALMGKRITILGYTFKQDTNDTRESPAIEVIKVLLSEGPAEISIFDPGCTPEDINHSISAMKMDISTPVLKPNGPVKAYNNVYDACSGSSAILILTPWKQFYYPVPVIEQSNISQLSEVAQLQSLLSSSKSKSHVLDFQQDLTTISPAAWLDDETSMNYLVEEPECPQECQICQETERHHSLTDNNPIDWRLIALSMENPKWVFDGRNVVDGKAMAKLGYRVENLGNSGPRWNSWSDRAF